MRKVDFEILDRYSRISELKKNPTDKSIIIYTLERGSAMDPAWLNEIDVTVSLIRQKLTFHARPEILLRIIDDLERLKLKPFSQIDNEIVYNLTEFFDKIP